MTDTESSRDGSRDNADMLPMKGPDEHIREDSKVGLLNFENVIYALSTTRVKCVSESDCYSPHDVHLYTSILRRRIIRPTIADINSYAW